jgi:phosphatidylserine decarboxylase
MTIHKEGYTTIGAVAITLLLVNLILYKVFHVYPVILITTSFLLLLLIVQFFRLPARKLGLIDENSIIAPCDGEVVVIEETNENEYFNDKRLQVSIFMSPLNVHANWYPVHGLIKYFKYHAGDFLVAWHPKSSTENERTTVVIQTDDGKEVLVRQIAGAVARRIVAYPKVGERAVQGNQLGFIKFGSRVDIFLPLGTKINVTLDEKVKGIKSIIGKF